MMTEKKLNNSTAKSIGNIPRKYIIEIGKLRKLNLCALCGKKMDIAKENYNIQLCQNCRIEASDKIYFNMNNGK